LPGGEIFQALKDRKVDAAEWVGPYDDEKLNLQAVSTYYYYPAWWEPSTMLTVLVNKQAYDALPPTYKAVVAAAAATTNEWMMAAYDARNPQAYKRIVSRSSNVRLFSDALMIAAYQEAFRIYDEEAAKNPFFKRVFTNWRKFRVDANYWHMTAELAMSNFTARWR